MIATKAKKKASITLKDPKSPVPAWIHYGIFSHTETKIRQMLNDAGYQSGYLIGLRVGYIYRKRPYMMAFGSGVGDDERFMPDAQLVLGEDQFIALYSEIRNLFVQNSDGSGDLSVYFDIAISGSLYQLSIKSDIVQSGECNATPSHLGQMMVLTRVGNEPWKCTHQSG